MNMEGTLVYHVKLKASDLCDFIGDFDFLGGKNIRPAPWLHVSIRYPMDPHGFLGTVKSVKSVKSSFFYKYPLVIVGICTIFFVIQ